MTDEKNNGGDAFPVVVTGTLLNRGMSLRDYMAGQAMQGEQASQDCDMGMWKDAAFDTLAKRSYKIADAMLKAREA